MMRAPSVKHFAAMVAAFGGLALGNHADESLQFHVPTKDPGAAFREVKDQRAFEFAVR
jgi:hypothetical protein